LEVVVALELTMFASRVGYDVGIVGCGFLDISWNLDYALSLQRSTKEGKLLIHMKENPAHSSEVVIGRPEAHRSLFRRFVDFSPLLLCDKLRYGCIRLKQNGQRDCQSLHKKKRKKEKKKKEASRACASTLRTVGDFGVLYKVIYTTSITTRIAISQGVTNKNPLSYFVDTKRDIRTDQGQYCT
jgi:hypothetical protein